MAGHSGSTTAALGLLAMLTCLPWRANAARWYVDSTVRSASADGTSPTHAWPALAAIDQNRLGPGDVVIVRPGEYREVLHVTRSGSGAGKRITYLGSGLPRIWGIDGGTACYIAVLGFHFTQPGPAYARTGAIRLSGATGWLIEGNRFVGLYGPAIDARWGTVNRYLIIRANLFDRIGYFPPQYTVGNDIVFLYGDHNLVEYNIFGLGMHRIYSYSSETIIRNNLDTGTNETLFPQSHPYPEHIDDVHGGYTRSELDGVRHEFPTRRNFIDRNWWSDNAGSNGHNNLFQDQSGTEEAVGLVVRQNVSVRTGSGFATAWQGMVRSRVYNNTIVQSLHAVFAHDGLHWPYVGTVSFQNPLSRDVDYRNNIFYYTHCNAETLVIATDHCLAFRSTHNVIYGDGRLPPGNERANPRFTDPKRDDFSLARNSRMAGAGAPVAQTTADGGPSAIVPVSDATGFCDGFGIDAQSDGDLIRVGSSSYVRVARVNYSDNTLIVAHAINFKKGDAVYVQGTEDIGAEPRAFAVTPVLVNTTPTQLQSLAPGVRIWLTASTPTPDAIRKVEFLVDGLPVGTAYPPELRVRWTADGRNHVVEARAYNNWASRLLWVRAFNLPR